MPGSVISVFSEPDDYEAALRADGSFGLLVTGRGRFRARLTRVMLDRVHLSSADENLPRIAFVSVPVDKVMIPLELNGRSTPIWGGIRMQPGGLISFGPSHRMHVRTEGPARWAALYLPVQELAGYGRALIGTRFVAPAGGQCWQHPAAPLRHLCRLYMEAIRTARVRPETILATEASHALEQDLIHAAVSCLSAPVSLTNTAMETRLHETAVRFESLLETQLTQDLSLTEIGTALGVSARFLQRCCEEHLGMSPAFYIRLRRMQLAYRGLRTRAPDGEGVAQVARRHGFRHLGRFAETYRTLFGELPSATLRRGANETTAHLMHPRQRTRTS